MEHHAENKPICLSSPCQFAAGEDGKPRRLEGVAYSGDVVNHDWAGRVVFDLAGVTAAAPRIPVLTEHDRRERVGHTELAIGPNDIRLTNGRMLTNEFAKSVAQDADDGFPWQLSVHIEPSRTERLEPGAETIVNGRAVQGPARIYRQAVIREVSLTPTGVDPNTNATVFSRNTGDPNVSQIDPAKVAELETKVTQLSADLEEQRGRADAAEQRATKAEATLADVQLSQRKKDVEGLFSRMGREYSDEAAKPYIDMPAEAFAVVVDDLGKFSKNKPPAHLFSAGKEGAAPEGSASGLDSDAIYASRRPKE